MNVVVSVNATGVKKLPKIPKVSPHFIVVIVGNRRDSFCD